MIIKQRQFALLVLLALAACAPPTGAPDPTRTAADRTTAPPEQEVLVYLYDPELDTEDGVLLCSVRGLVPVTRRVEGALEGEALIEATMRLLLAGDMTAEEVESNLTTEFPLEGLTLPGVVLEGGTATVTLDDPQFQTSGGACRVSIINGQVGYTVMQFVGVENVRFLPDELFQP